MLNALKSVKLRTLVLVDRFKREVAGVAAIEFAIIAPIMILMFFATLEVSTAVAVNRKLARVSSTLGDLITQSQTLTEDNVTDIMRAAAYVMQPYDHSLEIIITQISIEDGAATVDWSRSSPTGVQHTAGETYTVPTKILNDDTYLVAAKVRASHSPLFAFTTVEEHNKLKFSTTAIDMEEEIFLRPRIGKRTTIKPNPPSP